MTRLLASPARRLGALGLLLLAVTFGALAVHVPGADTVGSVARANVFVGVVAVGLAATSSPSAWCCASTCRARPCG